MKTCPLCEASYPSHHTTCPTDGAMLIESRSLEPGTVIRGKYRIVRQLGRGGMGTVYLAEHILLGRQCALKFISAELAQDPTFLRRFRREAQAAIELRHPNVVEVVDLDQAEDGSPYIAMEYVEGPDLRHALNSITDCHPERSAAEAKDLRFGLFPVERALAIARGIAQGLGAAHAKGIIHRDVKPENILLANTNGATEIPKLLDFGIAAMKETATAISRTHGLMLTPQYAAPEQWQGLPAEDLDGRTDLYALGGVLYEMLTGQTAFHANNTEGWMYQHLHTDPQPPSQLRPELANWPGLEELVLRLLAKGRELRPKDAAKLTALLDSELAAYWLKRGRALAIKAGEKFTWAKTDQERQDDEEGFRCFERGHELSPSNPELLYWLARAHLNGYGVQENPVKASALYLRSAALGYSEAQYTVANQLSGRESTGAEYNFEMAAMWYRAAAEQGHPKAQWMLGDCFAFGLGVRQDDDEAIAWALKASKQGDEGGQRLLKALESRKQDGKPLNVLGYDPTIGYRKLEKEAEEGLRRGLEPQEAAPADPRGVGPINPYANPQTDLASQLQTTIPEYIRQVLAGTPPEVAAKDLGMTPEEQEMAHVAHFFFPNAVRPKS